MGNFKLTNMQDASTFSNRFSFFRCATFSLFSDFFSFLRRLFFSNCSRSARLLLLSSQIWSPRRFLLFFPVSVSFKMSNRRSRKFSTLLWTKNYIDSRRAAEGRQVFNLSISLFLLFVSPSRSDKDRKLGWWFRKAFAWNGRLDDSIAGKLLGCFFIAGYFQKKS